MSAEKKDKKGDKQQNVQQTPPEASASTNLLPEEEGEYGAVRISENVIAAVVRKYTLEVKGVVRFATGSIVGGLAEMIGRRSAESSVVVDLDGDAVNIAVTLVLEFGVPIPEVAALVQDVIRSRVEELTGKHVTKVDVIVQDLENPRAEAEADEGKSGESEGE